MTDHSRLEYISDAIADSPVAVAVLSVLFACVFWLGMWLFAYGVVSLVKEFVQ